MSGGDDAAGSGRPADQRRKAVIVISSHVARGSVGNRSAAFALEVLGNSVWSVPTILLPWHPGHGPASRIVPAAEQFGAFLEDLAASPWIGEVGAVLTGYMADAGQARAVARFVGSLKQRDPAMLYLCDPVIGDAGGLYVTDETAAAIRDALLPLADIATPNVYELGWLAAGATSGLEPGDGDDVTGAVRLARHLPCPRVVVTSAPALMRGNIASLLVSAGEALLTEHRRIAGQPSGSGDLFAAVFLSSLLAGATGQAALEKASAATFEVIAHAVKNGSDEMMLEACIGSLTRPMAMVSTRRVATARS